MPLGLRIPPAWDGESFRQALPRSDHGGLPIGVSTALPEVLSHAAHNGWLAEASSFSFSVRGLSMDRRELFGVLGTSAVGLVAMTERAASAERQGHQHSEGHEECLKACQDCAVRSCNETFHHCYEQVAQGKKEHANALHLVADCARFCDLSADLVANGSPLMIHSCGACRGGVQGVRGRCEKFRIGRDEGLCEGMSCVRENLSGDGAVDGRS